MKEDGLRERPQRSAEHAHLCATPLPGACIGGLGQPSAKGQSCVFLSQAQGLLKLAQRLIMAGMMTIDFGCVL